LLFEPPTELFPDAKLGICMWSKMPNVALEVPFPDPVPERSLVTMRSTELKPSPNPVAALNNSRANVAVWFPFPNPEAVLVIRLNICISAEPVLLPDPVAERGRRINWVVEAELDPLPVATRGAI
jgi:hypothetical protein